MPSKYGNTAFYNSKEWRRVSAAYMSSKLYICERCGKPAQICHHKKWLDDKNVHDPTVALNPDNLEALCIDCHNAEHGLKHSITIFDADGNVVQVVHDPTTVQYEVHRDQIDDVVARAKSLLCGLNNSEATEEP